MTQIYFAASLTALALLPVFALLLRACGPRWFSGPVAVCVVALVGWILVNLAIQLYFADLGEQMRAYGDDYPPALGEAWANDGAKQVFGVLFGGFYALIYYAPFALVYEPRAGRGGFTCGGAPQSGWRLQTVRAAKLARHEQQQWAGDHHRRVFALPILVCLARAFGPRWFNAWGGAYR